MITCPHGGSDFMVYGGVGADVHLNSCRSWNFCGGSWR